MKKPKAGDLVLVIWLDITTDPTGATEAATVTLCATPGFYVGHRMTKGIKTLVVTPNANIAPEWKTGTGWDAYPASVVREVRVVMTKDEMTEVGNERLGETERKLKATVEAGGDLPRVRRGAPGVA